MSEVIFPPVPIINIIVILNTLVLIGASYAIGRLLGIKFIEAAAMGFLLLIAGSNLATFIFVSKSLPLAFFPYAVAGILIVILGILKTFIPLKNHSDDIPFSLRTSLRKYIPLIIPSIIIYFGRTALSEPRAQTSFAQAWKSLYVEESFNTGQLADITQTQLGQGFINASSLYAPNTLGITALLKSFQYNIDTFSIYIATVISATWLTIWVLARALKSNSIAIGLFSFSISLYLLAHPFISPFMSSNMSDEVLTLAGALSLYFLTKDMPLPQKVFSIIIASSVLVFGRNFGAFYGALLCAGAGLYYLYIDRLKAVKPLAILALLFALFSFREVYFLLYSSSIFFPRVNMLEAYPFTWNKFIIGTGNDWGIVKDGKLNITAVYLCILGIFIWMLRSIKDTKLLTYWPIVCPFIFLLLPLILESVTGYRKLFTYNKIYLVSVWFITWYPSYLLSLYPTVFAQLNERNVQWRLLGKKCPAYKILYIAIITLVIIAPLVTLLDGKNRTKNFFQDRFIAQKFSLDRSFAQKLREKYHGQEFSDIQKRPIIYTHLEPGIGIRYSLDGSLFDDYDFFGECIQNIIKTSPDLATFVQKTNGALIYLSNGTDLHYYSYLSYDENNPVTEALKKFQEYDLFDVIESGKGILLIPKINQLRINTPYARVCNEPKDP